MGLGALLINTLVGAASIGSSVWAAVALVIDTVVIVGANSLLKPKLPRGGTEPVEALKGRTINGKFPTADRQVAYGECRVGGQIVFMETTGTDNEYLHVVVAHASCEVKSLGNIYLNDELVELSTYASDGAARLPAAANKYYDFLTVYDHHGAADQTHDTILAAASSQWSSDNDLRGIAYSVVRLKIDREDNVFGGGIPNITRQVQGKRVRDERTTPITGATATNPVVITSVAHGMVTGDRAEHSGVGGMVELNLAANQLNSITYIGADSYSVDGLDGSLFTAYTSDTGALNKTSYTANAALCVADYITSDLGFGQTGLNYDQVDSTALIAAADSCDESVTKVAATWTASTVVRGDALRSYGAGPIYQYRADNVGGTTGATAPTHTSGTVSDGTVSWTFERTYSETVSRYEINGTVNAGEAPIAVLGKMKSAMAGFVEYIGDTWVINAGAYVNPTITLVEGDMRGPINGSTQESRLGGSNRVRGTFANQDDNYNVVEYPAATNSTYLTEDAEEIAWRDVNLEFTTTSAAAQRIAKIALERARQQIAHTSRFSLKAMQIQAGDNFNLKFEKYGYGATGTHDGAAEASVLTDTTSTWTVNGLTGLWIQNTTDGSEGEIISNTATTITVTLAGGTDNDWDVSDAYTISKTFVCQSHKLVSDGGALVVEMSFKETASSVYTWAGGSETHQDPARNSILPDAFTVADPTNLIATSGTAQLITKGDTVLSRIRVGFTPAAEASALVHELAWRKRKTYAISSITQANPAVFTTTAPHNYIVGDVITNWAVEGMTSIIGVAYTITAVNSTTYTIGALDSTSLTAHTATTGFVDLEWEGNAIIASPSTSFYIGDVEDTVEYDIQVRATSAINKSSWVAIQHRVAGKTVAPTQPTIVATAEPLAVSLVLAQGTAEADFKKFQIWQHTANSFPSEQDIPNYETTDVFTTITGLAANTALYFWAKAVDTTGNLSVVSSSTTATPAEIAGSTIADDSIATAHIQADAVTNAKIGDNAVDTLQIATDAVENAQIAPLAVDTAEIAVDAVTNAKIGDNAVDTLQIANDAVENAQIAALAVDTAEIAVDAITNAKIGDNAVDTLQIANDAVENAQIANDAVENAQIAALAVGTAEIASDAVTNAKIGPLAVDTTEIAADAIENAQIAPLAVTDAEINDVAPETMTGGTFANKVLVIDGPTSGAAGGIIKSQNWVDNSAGWKIESDGSAQFNGAVSIGTTDTFSASNIVLATGDAGYRTWQGGTPASSGFYSQSTEGADTEMSLLNMGAAANTANDIFGKFSDGTYATPTYVAGERHFNISCAGYNGSTYARGASLQIRLNGPMNGSTYAPSDVGIFPKTSGGGGDYYRFLATGMEFSTDSGASTATISCSANGEIAIGDNLLVTGAISSTTGSNFATASGNSGFGTATPDTKLEVVGENTNQLKVASTSGSTTKLNLGQFLSESYIFNNYAYEAGQTTDDATKASSGMVLGLGSIKFQYAAASATPARSTIATISSTGLDVTGAISSTTGSNFATASGYVGIGTSTPSSGLHVVKATTAGHYLAQFKQNTTSRPFGVSIGEASGSTAGYPMFDILNSSGGTYFRVDTGTGNVGIGANPDGGSNKLLVTGSMSATGDVGIGTTSPSEKLHVSGNIMIDNNTALLSKRVSGNTLNLIGINNTGQGSIEIGEASTVPDGMYIYTPTDTGQGVTFHNGTSPLMYVRNDGNVGIGTTSPTYKLVVDDDASSGKGLHVIGGGGGGTIARFERDVGSTGYIDINSSSGDPQIRFHEASSDWTIGVESNIFEITSGSLLTSTSQFELTTDEATFKTDLILDDANAEINIKSGATGTTGALNFTFNTTTTNYGGVDFAYNTRSTIGPRLWSSNGYDCTVDSGSVINLQTDGVTRVEVKDSQFLSNVLMTCTHASGMYLGVNDSVGGVLNLYGGSAAEGGQINFYIGATADTTWNRWQIDTYNDSMRFFVDANVVMQIEPEDIVKVFGTLETDGAISVNGTERLPATKPTIWDVEADNAGTYAGSGDADIVDMVDLNAAAINSILSYLNL